MRSFSHVLRSAALLGLLLATSGCAVLGSNVEGNFSCRAPEGDCAPTSVIDGRATETAGEKADAPQVQRQVANTSTSGTLKAVLAASSAAQSRTHARPLVEVPLPNPPGPPFKAPLRPPRVARAPNTTTA